MTKWLKSSIVAASILSFVNAGVIDFGGTGLKPISQQSENGKSKIILKIQDGDQLIDWLSQKIVLGNFKQMLKLSGTTKDIKGLTISVEVDEEKFKNGMPKSVILQPKEDLDGLEDFLKLYLTFDKSQNLLKGEFEEKSISKESEPGSKITINSKNNGFECKSENNSTKRKCNYYINNFYALQNVEMDNFELAVKKLRCKFEEEKDISDSKECKVDHFGFYIMEANKKIDQVDFKNLNLNFFTGVNSKKVEFGINSSVEDINFFTKLDSTSSVDFNLSKAGASIKGENLNQKLWILYQKVLKSIDTKKRPKPELSDEILTLAFEGGAKYNLDYHINRESMRFYDENKTILGTMKIGAFDSKYSITFDKEINYEEVSKMQKFFMLDNEYKKQLSIDNFEYKISGSNILNFLGRVSKIGYRINGKDYLSKEDAKELNSIMKNVINHGFEIKISPLTIGKIVIDDLATKEREVFGGDRIEILTKVDKNNADVFSELGMISLLDKLKVDANIKLSSSDYEFFKSQLPFQYASIIDMFASKSKDKVTFKVGFDKGKVLINGKGFQ